MSNSIYKLLEETTDDHFTNRLMLVRLKYFEYDHINSLNLL